VKGQAQDGKDLVYKAAVTFQIRLEQQNGVLETKRQPFYLFLEKSL